MIEPSINLLKAREGQGGKMKLLEYKKRILMREFSFLSQILEMRKLTLVGVDEVKIKKLDANLLAMTGEYEEDDFPYQGNYFLLNAKEYFAVDSAGNIFEIPSTGHYCAQYIENRFSADTIGEELLKAGVNPAFIVLLERNSHISGDRELEGSFKITIFKTLSFDMVEYHSTQFQRAAQALEAELRK